VRERDSVKTRTGDDEGGGRKNCVKKYVPFGLTAGVSTTLVTEGKKEWPSIEKSQ